MSVSCFLAKDVSTSSIKMCWFEGSRLRVQGWAPGLRV